MQLRRLQSISLNVRRFLILEHKLFSNFVNRLKVYSSPLDTELICRFLVANLGGNEKHVSLFLSQSSCKTEVYLLKFKSFMYSQYDLMTCYLSFYYPEL